MIWRWFWRHAPHPHWWRLTGGFVIEWQQLDCWECRLCGKREGDGWIIVNRSEEHQRRLKDLGISPTPGRAGKEN